MKPIVFIAIALCIWTVSPLSIAGVSLDVAPVDEWILTSSSATFTIDFLGDPGESGLFYLQIRDDDPGLFMDISVEPAAGDMGVIMTSFTPIPPASALGDTYASPTISYYTTYEINVEDSQGNLPGGLLAQLTFYQEGYGSSLIRAFKAPDYELPVAGVLIAIVDFPGGNIVFPPDEDEDDIPIPGDGDEEVPEPATLLMLGLGGSMIIRKRRHLQSHWTRPTKPAQFDLKATAGRGDFPRPESVEGPPYTSRS